MSELVRFSLLLGRRSAPPSLPATTTTPTTTGDGGSIFPEGPPQQQASNLKQPGFVRGFSLLLGRRSAPSSLPATTTTTTGDGGSIFPERLRQRQRRPFSFFRRPLPHTHERTTHPHTHPRKLPLTYPLLRHPRSTTATLAIPPCRQ